MLKLFLTISLIFPLKTFAQEQALTLKDAWGIAFKNNQTIKSKRYELKQSQNSYFSSVNSYLPQVSLTHSFSRSGGDNSLVSNRFSANASVSQELLNFKTISSIKISKIAAETAELSYKIAVFDLRKNLITAYVNLYFALKTVDVNARIAQIRAENSKLIKLKYESGMESKGNMLYAEAQSKMAELAVRKSQRSLENYKEELVKIMGGGIFADNVVYIETLPDFKLDISKLSEYEAGYPDLKIYEQNLKTAKERFLSAKYDAVPSLRASGSWGYSSDVEFPKDKSWSMGLSLSLPLFSGGILNYSANTKTYKNSMKSYEEKLDEAKLAFRKDLKISYQDFLNAIDTAKTYSALAMANEERYKEGQIKYMAGKMSFIDLENLEQNMIDSRLNYLEYVKSAHLKKSAIDRFLGIETVD